ncbi:MAG TPA: GyrI-like domain-containing protein [Methylophilaceae bacterium]|nr:GyrI-like domain-containing protein [Methylophilaceae bacterium]
MKKQWLYFLVAFALPTLGILTWWGLFSTATIEITERGPYRYAYLSAEGPYSKLVTKRGDVEGVLRQQGVELKRSITIIFDDPRTTPTDQRKARTGFIIDEGYTPKAPLETDTIPRRRVISASIKAHPVFAYGKAYGALLDYTRQHNMTLHLPTVELYDASVLTVEMPLETNP